MKTGSRRSGRLFSYVYKPGTVTKYAVVLSKKNVGTAVVRNRTRRRVYSVLARHPYPGTLICIGKAGLGTASYEEVAQELSTIVARTV